MNDTETRSRLLDLARAGHRAPIGTHLVLHKHPDADAIPRDGARLGAVIAEAADFFNTPLAVPLMDLTIEKEALLAAMGTPPEQIESFHFDSPPHEPAFRLSPRMEAACAAIRHVAASRPDLIPMGMGIGPFSLMTKLVADPITPVFLAASGCGPADEPEVETVEQVLRAGARWVLNYISAQLDAGARAFILCEPAANLVYFSPNQLAESHEIFDRYVMEALKEIKALLDSRCAALVFHDCGELTDGMTERFGRLEPAMASLGSSRDLAADARFFSRDTVLYGNLPTKKFISPQLTPEAVRARAREISEKLAATGHPFILGSECDVLSVPGKEEEILEKVRAFLEW